MKLQEFEIKNSQKHVAKVFENHFNRPVRLNNLSVPECRQLLERISFSLSQVRNSVNFHSSQKNPAYLKLLMIEQSLTARIRENTVPPATTTGSTTSTAAPAAGAAAPKVNDPKLKTALDKVKKNQSLTPDEQKMVNAHAMQVNEFRLRRGWSVLKESEVQQAQVVLAAQEMVDKIQSMIEDTTELQFKELPALVDTIKNQPTMGPQQANQFNTDTVAALGALVQNLQACKQQLEQSLAVVAPGQMPTPSAGLAPAADAGADLATQPPEGMDTDLAADTEPAPELPDSAALGRSRR